MFKTEKKLKKSPWLPIKMADKLKNTKSAKKDSEGIIQPLAFKISTQTYERQNCVKSDLEDARPRPNEMTKKHDFCILKMLITTEI